MCARAGSARVLSASTMALVQRITDGASHFRVLISLSLLIICVCVVCSEMVYTEGLK
jgi:hypothetical protein